MGLGKLFCFESYSQLTCVLHSIFKIYFNWRSITLQHCDGPCHTSVCISHRYSCVPSILSPPPSTPTALPPRLSQTTGFGFPASYTKFAVVVGCLLSLNMACHAVKRLCPGAILTCLTGGNKNALLSRLPCMLPRVSVSQFRS